MKQFIKYNAIQKTLIFLIVASGFYMSYSQARPIPTQALISAHGQSYSKADLQTALASEELKTQLEEMGVDPEQLNDRIASLTASEIVTLNVELEQQPAGGIVGALATVFAVLVVTDILCATNIFTFVKCINK